MKNKIYILTIIVLAALSAFLFLSHRRDCQLLNAGPTLGMGRGHGMGMGMGMNRGNQEASSDREAMFDLIINGSSDTSAIYSHLEQIVDVQRKNQKKTILRILAIRDSLSGEDREKFLKKLNNRFCGAGKVGTCRESD